MLADLHALGLRLSMDDFGTGYSSLSQLRQLPIDEVKIDKSFVLGMSTSQGESFIARSIIELAHNLGLRVVAEGVEDELTRNLLAEMGCDKLQGFLVSRPLPDDRLESWLLARTGVRTAAPGRDPPPAVRPHLRGPPRPPLALATAPAGRPRASGTVFDGSSSTPL